MLQIETERFCDKVVRVLYVCYDPYQFHWLSTASSLDNAGEEEVCLAVLSS